VTDRILELLTLAGYQVGSIKDKSIREQLIEDLADELAQAADDLAAAMQTIRERREVWSALWIEDDHMGEPCVWTNPGTHPTHVADRWNTHDALWAALVATIPGRAS
jgi:hypothetical protein